MDTGQQRHEHKIKDTEMTGSWANTSYPGVFKDVKATGQGDILLQRYVIIPHPLELLVAQTVRDVREQK